MRMAEPRHDFTVIERSASGSAPGWGVTFGDDVLARLHGFGHSAAREIGKTAFRWSGQVVHLPAGR